MQISDSAVLLVIMIWVYKCNKPDHKSKPRLIVTPKRDSIIYRKQKVETNSALACLMSLGKLYLNSRSPYWCL
jgi:hypothetical protein